MLAVDVAEFREDFSVPFMPGIEEPEKFPQLLIRIFRLIHFPHALIVAEEGKHWRRAFDSRFESSASQGERAALGSADIFRPFTAAPAILTDSCVVTGEGG